MSLSNAKTIKSNRADNATLTVSIRIVADCVALSCQVARKLKRATTLDFTTISAIIFIHCWGYVLSLPLSPRVSARHTLLQFLVCVSACVNCKCVWLLRWVS